MVDYDGIIFERIILIKDKTDYKFMFLLLVLVEYVKQWSNNAWQWEMYPL